MSNQNIDTPIGEYLIPGEEEIMNNFISIFKTHFKKHYADKSKLTQRAIHAKSHGMLRAKLEIFDHGDEALQYSIFKTAATYDALVRISNGDGPAGADTSKLASIGFAIKVQGLTEEKLEATQQEDTQDFLFINQPAYMTKDIRGYLALMHAKDGGVFKKAKGILRNLSGIRYRLKASPKDNPLNTFYWSASPYKLGNTAIKYMIRPTAVAPKVENQDDDGLKPLIWNQISKGDASFDLFVQKRILDGNELKAMPIEDWSVVWDEKVAVPVHVGKLYLPQQNYDEALDQSGEHLVYSPWNTTKDFRPLGSLNRARKVIYSFSARKRHQQNNR